MRDTHPSAALVSHHASFQPRPAIERSPRGEATGISPSTGRDGAIDMAFAAPSDAQAALRFARSRAESVVTPLAFGAAGLLAFVGLWGSWAAGIRFAGLPDPTGILALALLTDLLCGVAEGSRIAAAVHDAIYAVLLIALASIGGILAAYAGQRFGMPLHDAALARLDRLIGLDWTAVTRGVDLHPALAQALRTSYATMAAQLVAPAVLLSFAGDRRRLRTYLAAVALSLVVTDLAAALLPVLSPVATVDRAAYRFLSFTGATPIEQLMALRASGPAFIRGDLGGIVSFPSFHATVAVLTPIALRRNRIALALLVPLDLLMLGAAMTEGAHYAVDVVAGGLNAAAAFWIADRLTRGSPGSATSVRPAALSAVATQSRSTSEGGSRSVIVRNQTSS